MYVDILTVIAGLILLIWGADRFVHGAAATARNLGVAPLMIGLTVVAFATSAPEILVSIDASVRGQPGLAYGNAIGSNIANIGLVLGTVAIIRPIQLRSATLRREMPALLAVSLLTVSLFLDSFLSRLDGVVMLTGLVIVMVWLARLGLRSAANDPIAKDFDAEIPADVSMTMAIIWLIVGLATLLIGAHPEGGPSTPRKRYLAARRAQHLADELTNPISVPELAKAVGVSRRVLERGFQETVGVSPQRYLRWNRMNRVHRELRAAHSPEAARPVILPSCFWALKPQM